MEGTTALTVLALALSAPAGPVQNADRPAIGSWDFSPRQVWSVERAAGEEFQRPGELRVMADGTCVFHDFDRQASYIFDREGRFLSRFAPAGSEPGQVARYLNCFIAGTEIVIGAPTDLHVFTREGRFVRSYPNDLFARFPIAFLDGRRGLFAPGSLRGLPGGIARILCVDLSSGQETLFDEMPVPGSEGGGGGPAIVVRGLTPTIEAGFDGASGLVYYGCSADYLLRVARADGTRMGAFSLQRSRPAVDEAGKREHLAQTSLPPERLIALINGLPDRLASIRRLWAQGGMVFVLPPTGLAREVTAQPIDVFSSDGRYLYRAELRLPGGLRFSPDDLCMAGDDLYSLCRDGDGRKTLCRFSIAPPPAR